MMTRDSLYVYGDGKADMWGFEEYCQRYEHLWKKLREPAEERGTADRTKYLIQVFPSGAKRHCARGGRS